MGSDPMERAGRIAGAVALITGAAQGIGMASARLFAREGAKVALLDVDADGVADVAAGIAAAGGEAIALTCDVTDEAQVLAAAEAACARFGPVTVLFNCAGGSLPEDAPVTEVDMTVWDRTMTLDLKGTMLCCRAVIPQMCAAGGGSIVNMSSGAALRGGSPAHVYTAAKGAILSLTRALAGAHAADNIRANAIASGRILTERILRTYGPPGGTGPVVDRQDAAGRVRTHPFWIGRPEDIANIALFLASAESRMITGATIAADGGRSAY